ncbi:CRE-CYP-34A5 protein [Caenorhabditis remanei]|uniref:CRE-CYP-34A5 protein n=1 Tax=Caenorhabditis remanei TaxID=31234 RepID=E3LHE5_CAERE|nr:CRE-CYP-34A5 protein [Caenorhabditis remanei]
MFFILIFISILTYFSINLWRGRQRNPKGPLPLPFIGNLHQLAYYCWKTGGIVSGYNEIKRHYGNVFTLWFGLIPIVYIADYGIAYETHVKRANIFGHRYTVGGMDYIREGRGIVGSNGDFWLEHRRFALQTLRNFGVGRNIMEEKIMDEYRYRIKDFSKTHGKNGNIEVHAATFFDILVGSVINQMLVSERFEQGNKDFEKLKMNLGKSLEEMSVLDSFTPLWLLKSKLWRWRTKTTLAPFDFVLELVQSGIRKRMSAIESGEHVIVEEGDDFVDAFLTKISKDQKEGIDSTFTLDTLAIDLYDLWLAGQETTSTTLTWACVCLLNHPEVVKKLRRELVGVTGGNRSVSLTDRSQTPFLNATINEVQRISSILNVNIFRHMQEDSFIDGQPIATGTVITTQLAMLHTDENVYKNPAEFNPERFLENNNLEKKLIPFGIGKRSCPGESLAKAELYLILGNLIMEYDLEPVGAKPEIKTPTPFSLLKRPPVYDIRFVPVQQ